MSKRLVVIALFVICLPAFGQELPRLGVLPFTGGPGEDADTITTLLGYDSNIMAAFTPVPVTNAVKAQALEQDFQLAQWIDSDTVASLGFLMNVDFLISGQIRRVDTRKLLIVSLINTRTFELVAGVCREYRGLDDIPNMLPEITQVLKNAADTDLSALPKLAVAIPSIAAELGNKQEAESLAQVLFAEIANCGYHAVVPRFSTARMVTNEIDSRMRDNTQADKIKALGRAVNARFVLETEVRAEGAVNVIAASIIDVESGNVISAGDARYSALGDGYPLMAELARRLTDASLVPILPPVPPDEPLPSEEPPLVPSDEPLPLEDPLQPPSVETAQIPPAETESIVLPVPQAPPIEEAPAPAPAQRPRPVPPPATGEEQTPAVGKVNSPRLWTLGISAGSSFAIPYLIATVRGTIAPLRYMFVELGFDAGLLSGVSDIPYHSLYPYANLAFFLPFPSKGGFYTGAGGGYMMSFYNFPEGDIEYQTFAVGLTTGMNLFDFIDISYTFRTNFARINHRFSLGYVYRF